MDTQIALKIALQWIVARVGKPDHDFNEFTTAIPCPDPRIPLDKSHRMHEVLAALRYPLGVSDAYKLAEHYRLIVSRFTRPTCETSVNVPMQMTKYLPISAWRAKYLFGDGDGSVTRQLAEFAYRTAIMANELYGCPLVSTDKDFYSTCGNTPTFGVESKSLLGVNDFEIDIFSKGPPVSSQPSRRVGYAPILCLYDRAEALGEHEVSFAIQSAVWLNEKSASKLQTAMTRLYPDQSSRPQRSSRSATTASPEAVCKLPQDVYRKGLHILNTMDNPRLELYQLLVPSQITSRYYRSNFANTSLTSRISDGMRQKMLDSLNQMYSGT